MSNSQSQVEKMHKDLENMRKGEMLFQNQFSDLKREYEMLMCRYD
jgi:hypothetical protein